MTWLKTSEERANNYSLEDPRTPLGAALIGDLGSVTGKAVNETTALSLSPFFDGVRIIAGDVGTSPLKVYQRVDNARVERRDHPLWALLHDSPADLLTSAAWRQAAQANLLLTGNHYSAIDVNGRGQVTGIYPLHPRKVERKGTTYIFRDAGFTERIPAGNMLHIAGPGDGIDGWSVIKLAKESIGLALALEESNSRLIANGARPAGFLSTPNALTPEAANRLRDQWQRRTAGLANVGQTPVLDNDIKWQQVGLSAEDAQFLESRKFQVSEIARWLNITPHMLKDLDRATFNNIEHLAIQYVTRTLRPWFVLWEQHLNIKLLTDRERRQGLYVEFDMNALLRGDMASRTKAYNDLYIIGAMTPNEIRARENLNPVEGGDEAWVRRDMLPLSMAKEFLQKEMQAPAPTFARAEKRRETRGPNQRLALREAFKPLLLDAAARMVSGEERNIRRIVSRAAENELRELIERYYFDEHPGWAMKVMGPVFRSYAQGVSVTAAAEIESDVKFDAVTFADTYNEAFAARYSASSRRDLVDLAPQEVEARLGEWKEGTESARPRSEQVAGRELVSLGDAVAKATWFGAGVVSLIWRTVGDSCPYCKRLDGKVVDMRRPFVPAGTPLEGEGTDTPLVPRFDVGHAPAHKGCNCTIQAVL